MTTIAVIIMLGTQYCVSLLRKAQVALEEGDWLRAQQCVRQCADETERILHAEGELLYPRLAAQGVGLGHLPTDLRQQRALITQRIQQITVSVMVRDTNACCAGIDALVELLSAHWQTERPLFQRLAGDAQLLARFAARLQGRSADLDVWEP